MPVDLVDRARTAYRRRCEREGWIHSQPANYSDVVEHQGVTYAVVCNAVGTLAVYRETAGGRIAWCEEWPDALNG